MRRTQLFAFTVVAITALMAGCSSNVISSTSTSPAGSVPVSISMTDDPPAGVSVLFFQVNLTAATLTPQSGSDVSLLSNNTPIQIDVTQLQALSAFLSTANVTAGTYKSLNLTFANPLLVIFNQSDTSLGNSCAVGSICQLTPTFTSNTAALSFTSSPFPITVSSGSPVGLMIDFHLNTVIQSDLSVNLSATNGVSVATLPPAPKPHYGFVTGTVGTVTASSNQFTIQTPWGNTFTIDTNGSTTFNNFPSSACQTAGISCVTQGQIVRVEVSSVASGGVLTASEVDYVQQAAAITVEGTIIHLIASNTSGAPPSGFALILHWNPADDASTPPGGMATINLASATTFSIDSNGFTMPSGLMFTGASSLTVGQNVKVTVQPGTLKGASNPAASPNGWGQPRTFTVTAAGVTLEPSQMTGMITGIDSSTASLTLGVGGGPFFAPWPMATAIYSFNVDTTAKTAFNGFNPESFSGVAKGDFVSVNGWLFPAPASGGSPVIVAQSLTMRPNVWF